MKLRAGLLFATQQPCQFFNEHQKQEAKSMTKWLRHIFIPVLCGLCAAVFSQDSTFKPPPAVPDVNLSVYRNAVLVHDYATAAHALHYVIASNPGGAPYADTLALMYVQAGQFLPASLLADMQLNTKGYTDMRMELKAVAAKGLNDPVTAISCYKTLYDRTANISYGLEQLQLEYAIKRLKEASITANKLLAALPAKDSTVLQVLTPDGKSTQQVPLHACILNIQGSVFMELGQKEDALDALRASLGLAPGFGIAKKNLKMAEELPEKKITK